MSDYTLALYCSGHDPSAAIFRDETFEFGAEQERYSRNKHAMHEFPDDAVRACLDWCDISLSQVETVLVPDEPRHHVRHDGKRFISAPSTERALEFAHSVKRYFTATDEVADKLAAIGTPVPPIRTVAHHAAHAASAYYPADFDDGMILTLDGRGEYDATVIWRGKDGKLAREKTVEEPNSLGFFFGAMTEYLGFRAFNGEGKVMGLAPYGRENEEIEGTLRKVCTFGREYDVTAITEDGVWKGADRLAEIFGRESTGGRSEFSDWEKDLAYTTQKLLTETVTEIVQEYCDRFDTGNVGLAGGVALNCKMNKAVMEHDAVDDVFIQPVANDAGLAVGACMECSGYVEPLRDVYLGPSFETAEIEELLKVNKIKYRIPDDLSTHVAEQLANGRIVGWFVERMEMGPRALGHRSILADPRSEASRDRVNEYVKHREAWRPFAPSMLEERANDYLVNYEPSRFMIKTFDTTDKAKEEIPAVLHPADKTTRPHTVEEATSPRYHSLIKEFETITGVPVVLNTSFNDHGEPIVRTPTEALKDFYGMGLDILVLEDIVVEKGAG